MDLHYTVYLIGQMTTEPATYEWKAAVKDYFNRPVYKPAPSGTLMTYETDSRITFIDPSSPVFGELYHNKPGMLNSRTSDQIDRLRVLDAQSVDAIVATDRNYVAKSDIAIANLNHVDPKTPIVGTLFELAWYYDSPEKLVIAFMKDQCDYLYSHPFVQKAVDVWVNNWEEACMVLECHMVR